MDDQFPLIYFFGVAPGLYEPLFPAFVSEWLSLINFSLRPVVFELVRRRFPRAKPLAPPERRYAFRTVQQRLHQAVFRERVLAAYGPPLCPIRTPRAASHRRRTYSPRR